jgi:hypothetical protein
MNWICFTSNYFIQKGCKPSFLMLETRITLPQVLMHLNNAPESQGKYTRPINLHQQVQQKQRQGREHAPLPLFCLSK